MMMTSSDASDTSTTRARRSTASLHPGRAAEHRREQEEAMAAPPAKQPKIVAPQAKPVSYTHLTLPTKRIV